MRSYLETILKFSSIALEILPTLVIQNQQLVNREMTNVLFNPFVSSLG